MKILFVLFSVFLFRLADAQAQDHLKSVFEMNTKSLQQETLKVINDYRSSIGLSEVKLDPQFNAFEDELVLSNIKRHDSQIEEALKVSTDNTRKSPLIVSHDTDQGKYRDRILALGTRFLFTGEVITCDDSASTPDLALKNFLNSPKHKAIVESTQPLEVSLSVAYDPTRYGCGYYWAWFFHTRRNVNAIVSVQP